MNAIEAIRGFLLKAGAEFTEEDITMERIGTETCFDARPLYDAEGKWIPESKRGEDCLRPHTQTLQCSKKHRHVSGCYRRVHLFEPAPALLIKSNDGFTARVFLDAEIGPAYTKPYTGPAGFRRNKK